MTERQWVRFRRKRAPRPTAEVDAMEQDTPRWSSCYAPHSSMYFDQFGKVRACCQNSGVYLGDVTRSSIREVWDSADAERMRSALERDEYSVGCYFCEWQLAEGNSEIVFARSYDRRRPEARRPRYPTNMEFALSNSCNLACEMCNGDWSSTIRVHRERRSPLPPVYGDAFFEELKEFLPHLEEAAILGGEPFLGSESLRIMEMLSELSSPPVVTVTTNGTIATPRVMAILESLAPNLVVSIDGATKETYESIRVGADFASVLSNLDRFVAELGTDGVSLTHCLMTTNWWEFGEFLQMAERRNLHVGVNVVRHPLEFSLYQLGHDQLREVVDGLRRSPPTGLTGVRSEMWDHHVAALEHRLTALAGPTPVPVPNIVGLVTLDEHSRERLREAIEVDGPSIRLVLEEERISSVEAPQWADPLHAHSWIGLDLLEVPARVGSAIGAVTVLSEHPEALVEGVRRITLHTATDERVRIVHIYRFRNQGSGLLEALLVPGDSTWT